MNNINLSDLLKRMNLPPSTHSKYLPQPIPFHPTETPRHKEIQCFRPPKFFTDIRSLSDTELVQLFGTGWAATVFIHSKQVISPDKCCQYKIVDVDTDCLRQCRRRFTFENDGKKRCGLHKNKGVCLIKK
tara:strand:- start:121 stop:510 length:390 start_codon:yes stop_codon:yes gene_type:complete